MNGKYEEYMKRCDELSAGAGKRVMIPSGLFLRMMGRTWSKGCMCLNGGAVSTGPLEEMDEVKKRK